MIPQPLLDASYLPSVGVVWGRETVSRFAADGRYSGLGKRGWIASIWSVLTARLQSSMPPRNNASGDAFKGDLVSASQVSGGESRS
jgi:hypothetical protein